MINTVILMVNEHDELIVIKKGKVKTNTIILVNELTVIKTRMVKGLDQVE